MNKYNSRKINFISINVKNYVRIFTTQIFRDIL